MKAKDVDGGDMPYLKVADLENMFEVFRDAAGRYYYNLNETAYVDAPAGGLEPYTVSHEQQWPLVSYAVYGTTRFAWLLMCVNGVGPDEMFEPVRPGTTVLCPSAKDAQGIAAQVNGR